MISDEQYETCRLAANEAYKRHKGNIRWQMITPEDDWEWHFARELIALAQQIKPLDWVFLDRYQTWISHGFDYDFIIPVAGDCYHLHYGDDVLCSSNSIDGLKEAAQQEYQRGVLSCLAHGGV